jgi:hypothetical protein
MPDWVGRLRAAARAGHLVVPSHSARFWELVNRYPKAERARGYLEGISAATGLASPTTDARFPRSGRGCPRGYARFVQRNSRSREGAVVVDGSLRVARTGAVEPARRRLPSLADRAGRGRRRPARPAGQARAAIAPRRPTAAWPRRSPGRACGSTRWPPRPCGRCSTAAADGFDQAAVIAADAPDVPGMILGKLLAPLDTKAVAVAPGGPGNACWALLRDCPRRTGSLTTRWTRLRRNSYARRRRARAT